ncbi:MAG: hypothetical protein CBC13_09665 [Planctomycetia bacterium TMED53]|nr:MAG: hypothetical protein CBC13_09665 [Planctomycetia bacterium TMED53]
MNTSQDDSRLVVPGSTILIVFLTLAIVIPLVSYRMAQSLVTPQVYELEISEVEGKVSRTWRSGVWQYRVILTPSTPATEGKAEIPGSISVGYERIASEGETEIDVPKNQYIKAVTFDVDQINDVIFLDSDGDSCHTIIVWGDRKNPEEIHSVVGFDLVKTPGTDFPWEVVTFNLSKIPDHLSTGYSGGDIVERQSELLVRRFPVRAAGAPEGTEMSMIWDFRDRHWTRDPRNDK